MKDGEWTQCMFKLERKNRFCNVARVEGSLYCGNHVVDDEGVVSQKTKKYKQELCKRVPCTLDPTHTVYLFDLKKHLVICNKLKEAEVMRSLPFYTANINSGTHAATGTSDPSTTVQDDTSATDEHSGPSSDKQASLFQTLAGLDFNAFAAKIDAAFDKHVPVIPTQTLDHAACNTLLQQKQAAGANHSILRHIQQQASILGHMESKKLLRPDCVYVELGAGRAMLSLALTQMYPSSPFVLIDRAGSRGKADQYIALDNKCTRAKIDIRHLNLAKMDQVAHQPLVCLSKHLCGVATDLSLRALANTLPAGPSDDATEAPTGHPEKMSSHLVGLAIGLGTTAAATATTTGALQDDLLLVNVGSLRGHDLDKQVGLALLPQIEFSDEVAGLLDASKALFLAPLQFLDGEAPVPAQRTQLAKGSIQVRQDGSATHTPLAVNPTIQQQITQMSDDLHLSEASCLKYWILASQPENRTLVTQRNHLAKDLIQDNVPAAAREFVLQETSAALSALRQLCRARIDASLPADKKDFIVSFTNDLVRQDVVANLITLLTTSIPTLVQRSSVHVFALQWQKTIAEILFLLGTSTHLIQTEVKALLTLAKSFAVRLDALRATVASTLQSAMGLGSFVDSLPFDAPEMTSLLHTLNFIQATAASVLVVQDTRRYNRNTGEFTASAPVWWTSAVVQELNPLVLQDKWLPTSAKLGKVQSVIGLYYALALAKSPTHERVDSFLADCVAANCFSFATRAMYPFAPVSDPLLSTPYFSTFQEVFTSYATHFFTGQPAATADAASTSREPALGAAATRPGDDIKDILDWATYLCEHCPTLAAQCWSTPATFVSKLSPEVVAKGQVAYMHFLAVSGKGNPSAAYKHIKDSPPPISWKRFFSAIESYRRLLMPDHPHTMFPTKAVASSSTPHKFSTAEVDALEAMFHIFQTMVQDDSIAPFFLDWPDVNVLLLFLGFVRCPIPSVLKGAVMDTLSSFVSSPPMGQLMWQHLESAQILLTTSSSSTHANQGILFELEQIESMQRTYPATLGFLKLMDKLFRFDFPDDCGANYRVPGAQPYLDFALHVFLKADTREYDVELDKWQILEQCLHLFDHVLASYTPTASDFTDDYVVLNPHLGSFGKNDKYFHKPKSLGFMLLSKLLTDSPVLRKLVQLLTTELSVTHLERTNDVAQVKYTTDLCMQLVQESSTLNSTPLIRVQENLVTLALSVLHRVFELEGAFVSSVRASALESTVVEPLHRLLVRTPQHVITLAKYIRYTPQPSIALQSAKLLHHLSTHLPPTHLVQLLHDHGDDREIRDGYVSVIMDESAAWSEAKRVVLDMLLDNVRKPVPNLSTLLLLSSSATGDESNNVLDALLLVLDNLNFVHAQPVLSERAHELVYRVLSTPTLQKIRGAGLQHLEGFLTRQIQTLPTLWSIQRHVTAHRDVLALIHIRRWLVQDVALVVFQSKQAAPLFASSAPVSVLLALLDTTSFVHAPPPMPQDDAGLKLADQCTVEKDQRLYIDVVKFQSLLLEHQSTDQSAPLVQWALSWNRFSERIAVEAQALEAWTALAQVLTVDHHVSVKELYQVWQTLLNKAQTKDAVGHLVELVAKVSVTLSFQIRADRVHQSSSGLSSYQRLELLQDTERVVMQTTLQSNPSAGRRARSWLYTSLLHLMRYGQEESKVDTGRTTATHPGTRDALSHLVLGAQELTLFDEYVWKDAFLSTLCRDASEAASEPLSMGLAMNVLGLILSCSSSGRVSILRLLPMPHLCNVHLQLRESNQDELADTVVSFFVQVAQSKEGALTLLHGGVVRTLMQCTTFPVQRPQWIQDSDTWRAAEHAYFQKWLPVLRLLGALCTALPRNAECIQVVLIFLHKHIKLVNGALNVEVHSPSLQRLVEMSQVLLLLRTAAGHPKLLESLVGAPKVVKLTQKVVHVASYYGRTLGSFTGGWWAAIVPRTLSEQEQADVAGSVACLPSASLFDECKWDAVRFVLSQATAYCRIRMLSWDSPLKTTKSEYVAIAVLDADQDWLAALVTFVDLYRKDVDKDTLVFLIENTTTVLAHHALHGRHHATAAAILTTLGSDFEVGFVCSFYDIILPIWFLNNCRRTAACFIC
ncbi:hypothetical protein DYB30_000680 [Aphanomyces astaci]|uniref:CHHC U11-48K-type domain-containing protein n=1 Tax=Aphanomyces astaci TaxID=112090 RepID=A0A397E889_APHAT|nr:hypothetical protein DYB30_000680 [Aphanomyces astaci]